MNSALYNKTYRIPQNIIERVRSIITTVGGNNTDGIRRAKFIVNNGQASYSMLKRLKNFFDYCDPIKQKDTFELAGGIDMKNFVERTLGADRNLAKSRKNSISTFTPEVGKFMTAQNGSVDMSVNEEFEGLSKNGLAVIFTHGDGPEKVLLVKRCENTEWCPEMWALVGGKIENETPSEGAKREVFEEVGLDINEFIGEFVIRTGDHIEYVFVATIEGEPVIKLSSEHTEYGWFDTNEIQYLEPKTPHLDDFIALSVQKLNLYNVDKDVQK